MDGTPRGRRRWRALAASGDEHSDSEINELLQELGVPTSDSKKQDKRRADATATPPRSAMAEVIELITPPREAPSPRASIRSDSPSVVLTGSEAFTPPPADSAGRRSGRRVSIVDLTSTPSPPPPVPAPARVAATANAPSPAGSPALGAAVGTNSARGDASRPSVRLQEAQQSVTDESLMVVAVDSDGRSDSDAELHEIFSMGLRRVVRAPPSPPPSPARSSSRSLDFCIPRGDEIGDARTPPPKKRKRPLVTTSPISQAVSSRLTSPAASPAPARAAKKPTGSTVPASISVRLERSLDASEAGGAIRQALRMHVYNGKPLSVELLASFDCKYPRVVVLDRPAASLTDSQAAGASAFSPCTTACAIFFDAHAFLKMLLEETYAGLVARVEFLSRLVERCRPSAAMTRERSDGGAQVFVVVEQMDRALVEYKKKKARKAKRSTSSTSQGAQSDQTPEISFTDLHQVAFQLFMDLGAHTQFTCDSEESAAYVAMVAREMVVSAARKSSEEEFLESVPRLHSFRVDASGVTANAYANAWLRMLQTIPGVSEDKAQNLMDHFPTLESLLRAYRDPTLTAADKEDLLTDKLHNARFERALSKRIYSIFMSVDPAAIIP